MLPLTMALSVMMLCFAVVPAPARQSTGAGKDPATVVKNLVDEGVRLLEAKNRQAFLETVMRAEELEQYLSKFGTMDQLVAELDRRKEFALMLEKFKAAAGAVPTFSADGARANLAFNRVIGNDRRLQFEKVGERWYLRD